MPKTHTKIAAISALVVLGLTFGFPATTFAQGAGPAPAETPESPVGAGSGTGTTSTAEKPESIPDSFRVSEFLKLPGQKDRVPGKDGAETNGKGITGVFIEGLDMFIKLIGSIALIVFIIGALLTIASEGKQDLLEKGKTSMVYAILGIIISMMAFIIVQFVQSILF